MKDKLGIRMKESRKKRIMIDIMHRLRRTIRIILMRRDFMRYNECTIERVMMLEGLKKKKE